MADSALAGNDASAADGYDFDCVIIGSGFGGSVVAARAAEAGRRVLVLERGKRYPPGSFPRTPLEMSTNFWDPSQGLFGLFDIWSFRKFDSIVSSGLGGGSLIYANVMLRKPEAWFAAEESWPIQYADLDEQYSKAEAMLGATDYPYVEATPKTRQFRDAAREAKLEWKPAPLAVSFSPPGEYGSMPVGLPEDNLHHAPRMTCHLCGECDIGCNSGAKNTTDLTYLSVAQRHGAQIRTLHEVKQIVPLTDGRVGYAVRALKHKVPDPAWDRRPTVEAPTFVTFTARAVVVSAGTYGSTYLLLRNRVNLPSLSDRLGSRFSGNGDYLGFISSGHARVLESSRAPVITSYVLGHDELEYNETDGRNPGFLVQDGGYPVVADWLGEAIGIRTLKRLVRVGSQLVWARLTNSSRTGVSSRLTDALGDSQLSRGMLPMLGMGRDLPHGVMGLRDGNLEIDWSNANSKACFGRIHSAMGELADKLDGTFHAGPSALLSRMVTVHPLGGCPMGNDPQASVVDSHGEVWNYPGLFVSDGSVMPGPVGTNPSLTIAALGERFAEQVIVRSG
jgi:cholesterol oxidase